MAEFASRGVGAAGLTTGIIGSALGAANSGLLGNFLGGGWNNNRVMYTSEDMPVNRYEAGLQARVAELETDVKLRDANTFTLGEMGKLRDYMEHKFDHFEHELCDQKVYNATNSATISCIGQQIHGLKHVLDEITQIKVPNRAVCPGWGDVQIVPVTNTTTTTTTTPAAGA